MTINGMTFDEQEEIGKVVAVDTGRALIEVRNADTLAKCVVGSLVAIAGRTAFEFLIGVIDQAKRGLRSEVQLDPSETSFGQVVELPHDLVRIALVGTLWTKRGSDYNVFKRGVEYFPELDRGAFVVHGKNLERLVNSLAVTVSADKQLVLGKYVGGVDAAVVANGDKFFQRHAAVLGSTGSGKSWATALILERASALPHTNIIVLDMHGEYRRLATGHGDEKPFASFYRIAGPSEVGKDSDDVITVPYWALNREEMNALLLDRNDSMAPNQATRLAHHVHALRGETLKGLGLTEAEQSFTVDSPIPYKVADLRQRLVAEDTEMVPGSRGEKQGPFFGKLTRFITRLDGKLTDKRYGFMFQPPESSLEYGWLSKFAQKMLRSRKDDFGIKIIDFSEVPPDVLPIVVGVLARLLYDVQFWMQPDHRTPFAFVCDEAHLYLPAKEEADSELRRSVDVFERIAKEGRKYGVALVVISQRPSDVSRTILSQCNNFLALRLTNDTDQSVVKRLMPDSMAGLVDVLSLMDTGEALLLGDAVTLPSRIRLDTPKIPPESATRNFWTEWGTKTPDLDAIGSAVEAMRLQTRPRAERAKAKAAKAAKAPTPKAKKTAAKKKKSSE